MKNSLPDPMTGEKRVLNDFVVKGTGMGEVRHRGQHMSITYSIERQGFYLRDLGTGFGCFSRIDKPTQLGENSVIQIGSSYLLV